MKPEEFEQAVLAGEITDFEPYLQETNNIKEDLYDMGLMTKYRALMEVPSTIEKTMSEAQLFESGSPFWATDLTTQQIRDVLDACKELERQGYSEFVGYLLTQVREPDYDRERAFTDLPVLSISYRWYKLDQEMRKNQ